MKDLIALVPDKNVKDGLEALLKRYHSLGIREINFDIYVHPERDPGIFKKAHSFLRQFSGEYKCALVFMDLEGCGQESSIMNIETSIRKNLEKNGWQNRCEVIIFNPEVEVWLWIDSPHFYKIFKHQSFEETKEELNRHNFNFRSGKPEKPKEAFEFLLRGQKIPRSSSIYKLIAEKASFSDCVDPSFQKFITRLKEWFS